MTARPEDSPVKILIRWQEFGGSWRVLSRSRGSVTVALCRCDRGEELDQITSGDPRLLRWLAADNCLADDELAPMDLRPSRETSASS